MTPALWKVGVIVFVLNLPFGLWRAGVRRFSVPWFVSIHAPIPAVVALRFLSGIGYHLVTFPVLIGAYFAGQLLGGRLGRRRLGRKRHGREHHGRERRIGDPLRRTPGKE